MSEPFLSEVKIVSFGFAPKGWTLCDGQLLPINQNQALFSLLGTTYGGDGRINFGLPNLQGRVATHMGSGLVLGQRAGEQNHTLAISEIPTHVHTWKVASANGNGPDPTNTYLGSGSPQYNAKGGNLVAMAPTQIGSTGGSQPHLNMQPFLTLNFIIALQGIFPSQT
jgi:microcystin-dependent protein